MIKEVETGLFNEIADNSILLHQANCFGYITPGIVQRLAKNYPEWFKEYHDICRWFKDGYENELLGSFYSKKVSPNLIVCSAFAQLGTTKYLQKTDYDAWDKILRKIHHQMTYQNSTTGKKWTLHATNGIGHSKQYGSWEEMFDLFERYFKDSEVDLYIHSYY